MNTLRLIYNIAAIDTSILAFIIILIHLEKWSKERHEQPPKIRTQTTTIAQRLRQVADHARRRASEVFALCRATRERHADARAEMSE